MNPTLLKKKVIHNFYWLLSLFIKSNKELFFFNIIKTIHITNMMVKH